MTSRAARSIGGPLRTSGLGEKYRTSVSSAPGREFWHVYLDEAGWVCGETVISPAFLEFDIVLEHKFGVVSRRQVNIQTAEDEGPDVNVMLDGVRRVSKLQVFVNNKLLDITMPVPCYLITPEALLVVAPAG